MGHNACLITGGAGFIGTALSANLCDRFDHVVVVDNLHSQIHSCAHRPDDLDSRAQLIVGDITNPATWNEVLSACKPLTIIHLAAETGTGQSLTESTRHSHVNVTGTSVMLDALVKYKCLPERVILTSSRAVYGEGAWVDHANNDKIIYPGQRTYKQLEDAQWDFPGLNHIPNFASATWTLPVSVYGATKLAQEHMMSSWCNALDVDYVFLRLQNVYGPGQSLINPYTGIVSLFCRIARENKSIPLYEDGEMTRDFVYIDDVVEAITRALDSVPVKHFDIGTGVRMSLWDIARAISNIHGSPDPHLCGMYRFGDVRHAACDISTSITSLKWRPKISVEDGLLGLSKWIEHQICNK